MHCDFAVQAKRTVFLLNRGLRVNFDLHANFILIRQPQIIEIFTLEKIIENHIIF